MTENARRAHPERGQQRPENDTPPFPWRAPSPPLGIGEFFINVADNGFLNHTAESMQGWGYAVFGKVVGGTDVVDRIKAVKTGRKGFHDDVPVQDVVIEKATVV